MQHKDPTVKVNPRDTTPKDCKGSSQSPITEKVTWIRRQFKATQIVAKKIKIVLKSAHAS